MYTDVVLFNLATHPVIVRIHRFGLIEMMVWKIINRYISINSNNNVFKGDDNNNHYYNYKYTTGSIVFMLH